MRRKPTINIRKTPDGIAGTPVMPRGLSVWLFARLHKSGNGCVISLLIFVFTEQSVASTSSVRKYVHCIFLPSSKNNIACHDGIEQLR